MLSYFHVLGKDAEWRIRRNNFATIGTNSGEQRLRTIGGNSSGPVDLLIFNPLRISPMFFVLIIKFETSGYCTYNRGSGVLIWGRVEFLPKMDAIKSALIFEPETTVPSVVKNSGNEECLLKIIIERI